MSVLYDCNHSDHHQVSSSIDSDAVPECVNSSVDTNEITQVIYWDTLLPRDIDAYTECTKVELYKMTVPPGVKCNDPNCHSCSHYDDFVYFYNYIVGTLKRSGHALISNHKYAFKHNVVPGWNDVVPGWNDRK